MMADLKDVRSVDWWEADRHANSANMGSDCGAVGAWHHHRRASMHCNSRLSVHRPTWVSCHWLTRVWLAWHSHGLAGVRLAWHWLSWHSHGLSGVGLAWLLSWVHILV